MKKYISIISVILGVSIAGCKKNYLDQEISPNNPSVTTPQFTLAASLNNAAGIVATAYTEFGVWGGYWTNSGNYTPSPELAEFSFSTTDYPGPDVWDEMYSDLTNLNNLETTSSTPALANFKAIAIIMKAYDFQQLVDNFEDVPYSQAFQPSKILFPAYDKGPDIYADLVKQLDAAIALINSSGSATLPGSSDIIYGSNAGTEMTNWKKFANTLKLRLAIRQSNLSTNTAKADLASTASEGYIDATSEADAQPGYANVAGKENPFYGDFGFGADGNPTGNNAYFRANYFAIQIMNNLNDPRASAYYAQVPKSATDATLIVRGNQLGNSANLSNTYTSAIGPGLLQSPTQKSPVFSAYESLFLQAEAVQLGYIQGTVIDLYHAGIQASFNAVNITSTTAYAAYLANADAAFAANPVNAIITQKYISLNGLFNNEAYQDWKRTGVPALPENPASADNAAVSQVLPRRLPYPQSELTVNSVNLANEGTVNVFTSKVFWDTKQ